MQYPLSLTGSVSSSFGSFESFTRLCLTSEAFGCAPSPFCIKAKDRTDECLDTSHSTYSKRKDFMCFTTIGCRSDNHENSFTHQSSTINGEPLKANHGNCNSCKEFHVNELLDSQRNETELVVVMMLFEYCGASDVKVFSHECYISDVDNINSTPRLCSNCTILVFCSVILFVGVFTKVDEILFQHFC